jgi:hypothetical protein
MAISSGVMTVTTTKAVVDSSSANPFTLIVHNESGSNAIRLGGSDLTASNGVELHSHTSITIPMGAGDQLFAITTSGSHDLSWIKIS